MTTRGWHADVPLLTAYLAGSLDAVGGASVEQHLVRCADCRAAIADIVRAPVLKRAWAGSATPSRAPRCRWRCAWRGGAGSPSP